MTAARQVGVQVAQGQLDPVQDGARQAHGFSPVRSGLPTVLLSVHGALLEEEESLGQVDSVGDEGLAHLWWSES